MKEKISSLILLVFMTVLILSAVGLVSSSGLSNDKEVIDTVENTSKGYNINITMYSNHVINVEYTKIDKSVFDPSVSFVIDGHHENRDGPSLKTGERWSTTLNLSTMYNVSRLDHDIEVYTVGPRLNTSLKREYNLEDPDIPATRIQDVEVIETTRNDEPTAAVDVVLENPSPRAYSGYIYAHTLQTSWARAIGTVPVDQNTTVARIYLREDPDEEVEGELRLTTARLDEDRGLRDQAWFRGTADGETEWEREPYEPVGYENGEDPYRYDSDDEGLLESIGMAPKYAAGGIALGIGFLIFLFRGRSKW